MFDLSAQRIWDQVSVAIEELDEAALRVLNAQIPRRRGS